jgi:hypothetical protein
MAIVGTADPAQQERFSAAEIAVPLIVMAKPLVAEAVGDHDRGLRRGCGGLSDNRNRSYR